jgi:hypothetical protein
MNTINPGTRLFVGAASDGYSDKFIDTIIIDDGELQNKLHIILSSLQFQEFINNLDYKFITNSLKDVQTLRYGGGGVIWHPDKFDISEKIMENDDFIICYRVTDLLDNAFIGDVVLTIGLKKLGG